MIEFDVDIGYLLEDGELDKVILNDENGEHEPMEFWPHVECEDVSTKQGMFKCSKCGCTVEESGIDWGYIQFCPDCGRAVKR